MRNHSSDSSPEDSGGSAVVDESSTGVGQQSFPQKF